MSAFPDMVPCNVINFLPNFGASNVTAKLGAKNNEIDTKKHADRENKTEQDRQNKCVKTKYLGERERERNRNEI
jgi:hypothetical protein